LHTAAFELSEAVEVWVSAVPAEVLHCRFAWGAWFKAAGVAGLPDVPWHTELLMHDGALPLPVKAVPWHVWQNANPRFALGASLADAP